MELAKKIAIFCRATGAQAQNIEEAYVKIVDIDEYQDFPKSVF